MEFQIFWALRLQRKVHARQDIGVGFQISSLPTAIEEQLILREKLSEIIPGVR